eukprot:GDKJ01018233.1.p1 GENE.GDKJ01018233.1~~GDKJ01018233.1.p1  ORF type:complete len:1018 (+),score=300.10 GDKJ01018233.1:39-3092(+)
MSADLEKKLSALNEEIAAKESILSDLKSEIKTKEKQLTKDLDKTTAALKTQVAELQSDLAEKDVKLKELSVTVIARENSISEYLESMKKMEEKVTLSEKSVESKVNTLRAQYETKISSLQNEIQSVISARAEWESNQGNKVDQLREEVASAELRATEAEATVLDLKNEIQSMEKKLEEKEEVNQKLQKLSENSKQKDETINLAQEEKENLRKKMSEMNEKYEAEIESLKKMLNAAESANVKQTEMASRKEAEYKQEIEEMKNTIEKFKTSSESEKTDLKEALSRNFEKKEEEQKKVLESLEEALSDAKVDHNNIKEELSREKKKNSGLESEIQNLKKEIVAMSMKQQENAETSNLFKSEITKLKQDLKEAQSLVIEERSQTENMKISLSEAADQERKTLMKQISSLQSSITSSGQHVLELESKLKQSDMAVQSLNMIIATHKSTIQKLEHDVSKAQESTLDAQRVSTNRLQEMNTLQSKYRLAQQEASLLSDRIRISDSLVQKLEHELNNGKQIWKNLQDELRAELERTMTSNSELKDQISSLVIEASKWFKERSELMSMVDESRRQSNTLERSLHTSNDRVRLLERELINATKLIKVDKEKINELEAIIVEKERSLDRQQREILSFKRASMNKAQADALHSSSPIIKQLSHELQKLRDQNASLCIEKKLLQGDSSALNMEARVKDGLIEKLRRRVGILERCMNENRISLPLPAIGNSSNSVMSATMANGTYTARSMSRTQYNATNNLEATGNSAMKRSPSNQSKGETQDEASSARERQNQMKAPTAAADVKSPLGAHQSSASRESSTASPSLGVSPTHLRPTNSLSPLKHAPHASFDQSASDSKEDEKQVEERASVYVSPPSLPVEEDREPSPGDDDDAERSKDFHLHQFDRRQERKRLDMVEEGDEGEDEGNTLQHPYDSQHFSELHHEENSTSNDHSVPKENLMKNVKETELREINAPLNQNPTKISALPFVPTNNQGMTADSMPPSLIPTKKSQTSINNGRVADRVRLVSGNK